MLWGVCTALVAASTIADEAVSAGRPADMRIGDCVIFREGGLGRIIRTPVYWLKGTLAGTLREQRVAGLCPEIGKPVSAYSRADHLRVAQSLPCVASAAEVGEVTVLRVQVSVADWETPWADQHGTAGWLYRGQFLDQPLRKGALIDMQASWLERCRED